jgi:hypothetical protein
VRLLKALWAGCEWVLAKDVLSSHVWKSHGRLRFEYQELEDAVDPPLSDLRDFVESRFHASRNGVGVSLWAGRVDVTRLAVVPDIATLSPLLSHV